MSIGNTAVIPATSANNVGANDGVQDVVGNKDDANLSGPGNDSLYGIAGFMAYHHTHSPAMVYPDLADPIVISAAAAAWTYGAWIEVIPAAAISEAFDIHWVHTGELSAQGDYQLQVGAGGAGSEAVIGTVVFSRDSNQVQTADQPIQIPPQPSGTRIAIRLATGNTSADTLEAKIYYHEYPA